MHGSKYSDQRNINTTGQYEETKGDSNQEAMIENEDSKISNRENWALKQDPVRRPRHAIPLNRRSLNVPI